MYYICVNIWSKYSENGFMEYITKMIFFFVATEITIVRKHDYPVDSGGEI